MHQAQTAEALGNDLIIFNLLRPIAVNIQNPRGRMVQWDEDAVANENDAADCLLKLYVRSKY